MFSLQEVCHSSFKKLTFVKQKQYFNPRWKVLATKCNCLHTFGHWKCFICEVLLRKNMDICLLQQTACVRILSNPQNIPSLKLGCPDTWFIQGTFRCSMRAQVILNVRHWYVCNDKSILWMRKQL